MVEICFGSYRAQTEVAWVVLCKTLVHKGVHISFGADPCAFSGLSRFSIQTNLRRISV